MNQEEEHIRQNECEFDLLKVRHILNEILEAETQEEKFKLIKDHFSIQFRQAFKYIGNIKKVLKLIKVSICCLVLLNILPAFTVCKTGMTIAMLIHCSFG